MLEGCSPALRVGEVLQRASIALGLQEGTKVAGVRRRATLRNDELLSAVLQGIEASDMLEIQVLECGGGEGEGGELCDEVAMLIQQSEKLASELESLVSTNSLENPATSASSAGYGFVSGCVPYASKPFHLKIF